MIADWTIAHDAAVVGAVWAALCITYLVHAWRTR